MAEQQTVVIWDTQIDPIRFAVLDGDKRHLHGKYVNSSDTTDEEVDEISTLMYTKGGAIKIPLLDEFPVDAVKSGAFVIVCGFLP